MKALKKSKKGFTLVEMILSLAIICIIGGVIAGICVAISNSFSTTYNIDDSTDYAMLYANGFENSFLSKACGQTGGSGDKWQWSVDPVSNVPCLNVSYKDGTPSPVFEPNFINTKTGSSSDSKWEVRMFYKWDAGSQCVSYKIFIKDNYSATHFVYMYEGSFWVPRYSERGKQAGVEATRKIYLVDDSDVLEESTFTTTYGWTDEEFAPIAGQMDSDYRSQIVYEWG